jgi:hypothetical protein
LRALKVARERRRLIAAPIQRKEAMQNAKSDVDLARAEAEFAAMAAQIAAIRKLQEGNFWWLTAHEALSFVSCRTSQATETATRQVSFQQRSGNACSR